MSEMVLGLFVISLFTVPMGIMSLFLLFACAQTNFVMPPPDAPVDASYQPMVMLIAQQKARAAAAAESRAVAPIQTRTAA